MWRDNAPDGAGALEVGEGVGTFGGMLAGHPLESVGVVKGGGGDPNQNVVISEGRVLYILQPKNLRTTLAPYHYGFHGVCNWLPRWTVAVCRSPLILLP